MIHRISLVFLCLLALASIPAAAVDVVATSPSMGALVQAVAGSRAKLTVLADQNRDLHKLQAKPTMMRALRGADLVVAVGAELEVGWLPVAIRGAANPKILPGTNGYFEAAAQVPLLDVGGAANRAMGDVHPVGNPHVNMDPVRMATVARALAKRLALIDSAGASQYRRGADAFAAKVDRRVKSWRRQARQGARRRSLPPRCHLPARPLRRSPTGHNRADPRGSANGSPDQHADLWAEGSKRHRHSHPLPVVEGS